jgi:uncharacterized integral membrane protein
MNGDMMTILRWILLTAMAVAFLLLAVANWTPVPFRMPDGAIISVQLPLLLVIAFVAGWLPTWLIALAGRAKLRRRLAKFERIGGEVSGATGPTQEQPAALPPASL